MVSTEDSYWRPPIGYQRLYYEDKKYSFLPSNNHLSILKKGKVGDRSDQCNQGEIAGFSLLLLQLWKHFWSLISFREWQLLFCQSTHNKVFTGTWSCLLSVYFWNINICMYFSSRAVIYLIHEVWTHLTYCMLILCSFLQPPHIPQEEPYTKRILYTWTGPLYFLSMLSLSNHSKRHIIWNVVMNVPYIKAGVWFVIGFKMCTVQLLTRLHQPSDNPGEDNLLQFSR